VVVIHVAGTVFSRRMVAVPLSTGLANGSPPPSILGSGNQLNVEFSVTVTLAPMVFRAENKAFFIIPNTLKGPASFANALFGDVDLPQRFGELLDGGHELAGDLAEQLVAREVLAAMLAEEPGQLVGLLELGDVAVEEDAVDGLVREADVLVE